MPFLDYLHRVVASEVLSSAGAREAMLHILAGEATTAQIAAFLVALRMRGEASDELLGFALAMRERATPVHVPPGAPLIDTCGTGGDGGGTFNVSTVAAFVVAGAGLRVAKHGNRSLSSQCGSADLLEELGVPMPMPPEQAVRAIAETGFGFLFAPTIHPAMKHAQPARSELKLRTAFNLLGPLTNPAGAEYQLIGAPSPQSAKLMAEALLGLPVKRAFVVHGTDGMDEITTTGPTAVWEVMDGRIRPAILKPSDFEVPMADPTQLRGGDRQTNAEIARAILSGQPGPKRDIVLVNAAAALVVAGKAHGWLDGMSVASESIDSGSAMRVLKSLTLFL